MNMFGQRGFFRDDGPGPIVVFLHDVVWGGFLRLTSPAYREHQRRVQAQDNWLDARAAARAAGLDPDIAVGPHPAADQ